jgi:uncharacterized protein (TIGR02246 family)
VTEADEVRAAAADLVRAFGSHDREAYFAAFAPSSTFLFHAMDRLLASRAEYEELWRSWEAEGFRVLGAESSEARVDLVAPGVAVFTHRVTTTVADTPEPLRERETIVFTRDADGRWLAVHEHLSLDPEAPA